MTRILTTLGCSAILSVSGCSDGMTGPRAVEAGGLRASLDVTPSVRLGDAVRVRYIVRNTTARDMTIRHGCPRMATASLFPERIHNTPSIRGSACLMISHEQSLPAFAADTIAVNWVTSPTRLSQYESPITPGRYMVLVSPTISTVDGKPVYLPQRSAVVHVR